MDHQWLQLAKIYFRFVVVVGEMAVTEFVTSAGSTTCLPQKLVTLFCTCIFSSVMDLFLNSYDPKQADINPTCFKSKELLT